MSFVKNLVEKFVPIVLATIYLFFSACSLHSIGDVKKLTESHLRKIELAEALSRSGQLLRQTLERQIGSAHTDTQYNLSYSLTEASLSTLSASGSSSTLNNTKMSVNYSLKDNETGNELTSGVVSATATSGTIHLTMVRVFRPNLHPSVWFNFWVNVCIKSFSFISYLLRIK